MKNTILIAAICVGCPLAMMGQTNEMAKTIKNRAVLVDQERRWLALPIAAQPKFLHPTRVVNGKYVDLVPLFAWWSVHSGAEVAPTNRALCSWIYLTGAPIEEIGNNWVVDASIYDSPGSPAISQRIIVQNPPVDEYVRFNQINQEIRDLNLRRQTGGVVLSSLVSTVNADSKRADIAGSLGHSGDQQQFDNWAAANRAEADSQSRTLEDITSRIDALTKQSKSICRGGVWHLDTFALRTGQSVSGMDVYDLGVMY